jgi:predicted dehydrogenase
MSSSSSNALRFAVIGGRRGRSFINSAQSLPGEVELVAVCDLSSDVLGEWKDDSSVRAYNDYQQVLDDPNIDAVCIATPVPLHAQQAIAAIQAGKHVLSEVTAAYTMDDCWALVEAVESSDRTYMMAENYCYMRENMMIANMVEQGVFGEITFASGAYLHDCRNLLFNEDGSLTWRGNLRQEYYGNTYPTHSAGPVAKWLGINKHDKIKSTATWQSPSRSIKTYVERNLPGRAEYLAEGAWKSGDGALTIFKTEKGIVAEIRVDWGSPRPHNMTRHELQGTKASFTSQEGESLIWIEDRSATTKTGIAEAWEPLSKYYEEFEHPLWREHLAAASKAGHGGGDYFVLREFAAAVREGRAPYVDVYDAVTWSSLSPLSMISVDGGGAPVDVPDFKAGRKSSS